MKRSVPLAERARPTQLDQVVGQSQAVSLLSGFLKSGSMPNVVFWGPPGIGKTTLSRIMASQLGLVAHALNATSASVKDIRILAERAEHDWQQFKKRSLVHIDEIHRLSKNQQDVLLPFTENGTFILAGSTTENPYFALNPALRSRLQLIALQSLDEETLQGAIIDLCKREGISIDDEAVVLLARRVSGDFRLALGTIEAADLLSSDPIAVEHINACLSHAQGGGARDADNHYDLASAYQKSLRGSDADAAIYYLARFLNSGEDPRFIARRLWVTAAEDVGNADPQAILIAQSAYKAVESIGLPEARIALAQATIYVARAPKSNAAIKAIGAALKCLNDRPLDAIPDKLKDSHYKGAKEIGHGDGYVYSHDKPSYEQSFLPAALSNHRFVEHSGSESPSPSVIEAIETLLNQKYGEDWFDLDAKKIASQLDIQEKWVRKALNLLVAKGNLIFKRQFRLTRNGP